MASDACILYIQERQNGINGMGAPLHMKSRLPYGNKRRANYNNTHRNGKLRRKKRARILKSNARAYISHKLVKHNSTLFKP